MTRASRTLLIVDDSPEDRELYRRYLLSDREYSYTILEASLGEPGLELWHQHQPDAVLLDYRLPDLDGLEFLRRLQPSVQALSLPVIVTTGQGNEAIAVQAIKAGAQDYLVKGQITPAGLKLAVNGAIEAVQLRNQLQQRIERERVIAQITRQIHQSLDLDRILHTTVTEVRQFLHTDRVLVFRLEPDGHGTVVAESVGAEWRSLMASTIHDPCLAENYLRFSRPESITHDPAFVEDYVKRYRQGQVTVIPDIRASDIDPCHIELLASFQVQANLVVPILHDDKFWGLLIAHHCTAPRSWQTVEIDLLQELTAQVGIALRQAELYQQAQAELMERQQVEASLRESETRFRQLAEKIDAVFWLREEPEGRVSYVSPAYERLWGWNPQEFYENQYSWVDHLHPDDRDASSQAFQEKAAAGQFDEEYRIVLADGSIRWVHDRCVPLRDETGKLYRFVGIAEDITDRKNVQDALRMSEARFRTSVENMLDCFAIYESVRNEQGDIVDFRAVYINDAACLASQMTRQQHLERGLCELMPGHRDSGLFDAYCQVVETGQPLIKENLIYEDQFGEQRLTKAFDLRVAKFSDGYVATWRDITDRKQVEESLRESEEFKRRMLDSSSDCIKLLDVNGRLQYMNTGGLCLLEIDDFTSYINIDWTDFWHEDTRSVAESAIATAKAGELGRFQGFCPTAKGTPKWWDVAVTPILDTEGQVSQILAISRDITDRRQAQESLRLSEERYRTLFESMEDGFCVIEMLFDATNIPIDYRFLEINLAFAQQTGLEQAVGKTARQLIPGLEDHWFETYGRVALTGEPVRFENGSEVMNRWFDVYAFPIEQPESRKIALLFKDISERKFAEQEREKLLAQEQAARAEAERANRIKDEFLAVLSHELRSPLNPILGWTRLLQTRKFDEARTAEALATIERNARLQTQLIDDLLDVAKILRGKLSMETTPIDLVFVVESAIDTVRTAAISKTILLHPVLPQIGRVSGDSARLQQVVWNLLSNAIKFTPNDGRVDILLERVGNWAQITISDTGKGINTNFLPHLFESFRQEDASTTRQYGGLGLGLAIVRSLVEAHGGTIAAASPGEGQGATFTVRLPLLDTKLETRQPAEFCRQNLDLTGIRVLAVDDEPDARELLNIVLTQYGAEVLMVNSAADVLIALETFRPDALISDIGMPEVDGYTLIQQIRRLPLEKGGQIPAIALTAYAREDDRQRALASGYQQYVTKPLDPEQLVQAVIALCTQ